MGYITRESLTTFAPGRSARRSRAGRMPRSPETWLSSKVPKHDCRADNRWDLPQLRTDKTCFPVQDKIRYVSRARIHGPFEGNAHRREVGRESKYGSILHAYHLAYVCDFFQKRRGALRASHRHVLPVSRQDVISFPTSRSPSDSVEQTSSRTSPPHFIPLRAIEHDVSQKKTPGERTRFGGFGVA